MEVEEEQYIGNKYHATGVIIDEVIKFTITKGRMHQSQHQLLNKNSISIIIISP